MDRTVNVRTYLDFEKPVAELESKIAELRAIDTDDDAVSITEEVTRLQQKAHQALMDTYAKLTPWQKTQVARHPDRPHCLDYVSALIEDFIPLAGDRYFAEDAAIMGGIGRFRGRSIVMIGHEKGSDTESRIKHNFGMARPEGYRKAVRLMDLAEKFDLPVLALVDTAGAYPGIGAEERGQAEAIARSTDRCLSLAVPMVAVVIGEGGSGGAVAIATANRVLMLEHSDLHGHLAGGGGVHPLARHDAGDRCCHPHEDHRAGFEDPRRHRCDHLRARRRGAPRSRPGVPPHRRCGRQGLLRSLRPRPGRRPPPAPRQVSGDRAEPLTGSDPVGPLADPSPPGSEFECEAEARGLTPVLGVRCAANGSTDLPQSPVRRSPVARTAARARRCCPRPGRCGSGRRCGWPGPIGALLSGNRRPSGWA